MSFGPACERCNGNSRDDPPPNICPYCNKPKQRGSRYELVKLLNESKHKMIMAVGYLAGQSIMDKEQITQTLMEAIKEINDV